MRNNTATLSSSYSINGFMRTYFESVGQNSVDGRSRYGLSCHLQTVQSGIKVQLLPRHAGNQHHSGMYLLFAVSLTVIAAAERTSVTLSPLLTHSLTPKHPRSVSAVLRNTWGKLDDNFVNGEICFLATDGAEQLPAVANWTMLSRQTLTPCASYVQHKQGREGEVDPICSQNIVY